MAGITFYDAYFPILTNMLSTIEAILLKAQAHGKESGIDADAEYLSARLHEDMNPLKFQVQFLSGSIQKAVTTLAGGNVEDWSDDETTIDQLLARVKKAREVVKSIKPEDINGKEGEKKNFQIGQRTMPMTSQSYITELILPNAFFHLQTAYAILRMKGVPLGKADYITPFLQH